MSGQRNFENGYLEMLIKALQDLLLPMRFLYQLQTASI